MKISSKAWLEGFHYWPRTDHEILAEYSDGLICLSGCLSAEIPKLIVSGDLAGARRKVAQYREVFGDRFYLELQDHGIAVQQPLNDELVKIGNEMGIPWVATNDSHYTHKGDAAAHEVLLCINTGSELSDPNRFKFDSDEFYLKTPEEMAKKFARWPGACETTLEVAERCNVDIAMGNLLLPAVRRPRRQDARRLSARARARGRDGAYGEVTPGRRPGARRVRAEGHRRDGLRRLLPRRPGLRQLGQGPGRSGSDRDAGARPARSCPTPRASPSSTRSGTT